MDGQQQYFLPGNIWSISKLPDLRMQDDAGTSGAASDTGSAGTTAATTEATAARPVAGYDVPGTVEATARPTTDAAASISLVPEAYRETEWAKNFAKTGDPVGEAFKAYDNAQKLIGQRPPVAPPGENASPEQLKAWRKYTGVPDDATGYVYEAPKLEGDDAKIGEYLTKERPQELISSMAQKAHELGLTPAQFKAMAQAYDQEYIKHTKATIIEMQQADAMLNQDFETKTAKAFGERKDLVLRNGKNVLDKAVAADSELRIWMNQFNNEQLVAVAAVAGHLYDRYEREDGFGSKQIGSSAASHEQLNSEIISLMASPAFRDKMHGDHAKVNAQINSLYERMGMTGAVYKGK